MYYKSIESQVGRLCTILLLIFGFSVTSRRGRPTSRRQNYISLSRRDVDLPRRDVKITCLCHVATWTSHVATSFFDPLCHVATWTHTSRRQNYKSLSRRDVDLPRRDVNFTPLCYVATWIYTSRCELVQVSVTSRRGPERRNVVWSCALSRRDVGLFTLYDVATSPRTSRRGPILRPKIVHFWSFTSHTSPPKP